MSEFLITFTPSEIEAIRAKWQDNALGPKALTDIECDGAIDMCRRYGAHPLRNQIVPTKFRDRDSGKVTLTYIVTIDLMRAAAHRTGAFAGLDDFEHEYTKEGSLVSSRTKAYRLVQGQRCPFPGTAIWDELFTERGLMAGKMPITWIDKCAESAALRRAFPLECGGLYVREEFRQAASDFGEFPEPKPSTVREVPQAAPVTMQQAMAATGPNAEAKPAERIKTEVPAPRAFTKDDLLQMVGGWSGAHPEQHLTIVKDLVASKGLKGVKPSDQRFQDFCLSVETAIDAGVAFAEFVGIAQSAPAQTAVEEF
jgi:phage recombination protein Bet